MIREQIRQGRRMRRDWISRLAERDKFSCEHEVKVINNETVQKYMNQFQSINNQIMHVKA